MKEFIIVGGIAVLLITATITNKTNYINSLDDAKCKMGYKFKNNGLYIKKIEHLNNDCVLLDEKLDCNYERRYTEMLKCDV